MSPWIVLSLAADASRWMNESFSSSISSGAPPTSGRLPTPAPEREIPETSRVVTKPPAEFSRRNTTPLPETTVGSPPPPPLPARPPVHEPLIGPTKALKAPPPLPIQTPAVRFGHELGRPAVHRSK